MPWFMNRLKEMIISAATASLLCAPLAGPAQERTTLTLEQAFALAEQQYPLNGQKALLRQSETLTQQNLGTAWLPQITLSGQASYQSDVTRVNLSLPGIKIPEQPKDQYRAVADVSQLLFDGGLIRTQREVQQLTTAVEEQRAGVELYGLKTRINQLFFSILYHDELLQQVALAARDVQIGIDKVQPQVAEGTALRSNLLLLQAQLLQTEQRAVEIRTTRKGLVEAFSLFLKQPLPEDVVLELPLAPAPDSVIARPELQLYESQSSLLAGQQKLIGIRNRPRASAFVQGGYGRPGLNLLSDELKGFYIGGLRLTLGLGGLYTARRDRQLLDINRQSVDLQKESFLLATRAELRQQQAEIDKYAALIATDEAIIALRRQVTDAAKAQLENAVITANDYLQQVTAEDAARHALILHRLQLLQAQTNYAITSGKL